MKAATPIRARKMRRPQSALPCKFSQEGINQDKISQTMRANAASQYFNVLVTATL
jgi:hypothetical protein